jgi:hypothetical protein
MAAEKGCGHASASRWTWPGGMVRRLKPRSKESSDLCSDVSSDDRLRHRQPAAVTGCEAGTGGSARSRARAARPLVSHGQRSAWRAFCGLWRPWLVPPTEPAGSASLYPSPGNRRGNWTATFSVDSIGVWSPTASARSSTTTAPLAASRIAPKPTNCCDVSTAPVGRSTAEGCRGQASSGESIRRLGGTVPAGTRSAPELSRSLLKRMEK